MSEKTPIDVLCLGHSAYDLIFPLDEYPAENVKIMVGICNESGGGPAANAAYLIASWDARCAIASLVGDDAYGRAILEEFHSVGADTSLLEVRPGHATSLSAIWVNEKSGSRTIVNRTLREARLRLDPDRLAATKPSVMLFDGHQLEAAKEALEAFPEAETIIDAGTLYGDTESLVRQVDYVIGSERFATQYAGVPDLDGPANRQKAIDAVRRVAKSHVAITMGERGLVYHDGRQVRHMPAVAVEAVDTTAAGDIFHGAFAYGVVKGMSFEQALDLASHTAALSVTRPGGRQSIPALEEVQA